MQEEAAAQSVSDLEVALRRLEEENDKATDLSLSLDVRLAVGLIVVRHNLGFKGQEGTV